MNTEHQQEERPNYILHYRLSWEDKEHRFSASDDNKAREITFSFIEEQNRVNCLSYPIGLERIAYVTQEVEVKTQISLRKNNPQEEKPNYVLRFRARVRDDWLDNEYRFNAPDDDRSREMALSFIEEKNERDRQEIYSGKKSGRDWCIYEPLKLERITYSIREVAERTPISLQGDVASRVKNGEPIELSELTNL
ncbi:hypothetical protein HYT51_00010 [Candidatus Woesearchaeota archaeon]|nr:hypothetical protein [Candidatus Woesearchaeota archaeon]